MSSNAGFWYAYDVGALHIVVLSSEHDLHPGSPQMDWLTADLLQLKRAFRSAPADQQQRQLRPWIVLCIHRPLYASLAWAADDRVSAYLRRHLEPALARFRVDLVIAGHYHSYERSCPVLDGQCMGAFLSTPLHSLHAADHHAPAAALSPSSAAAGGAAAGATPTATDPSDVPAPPTPDAWGDASPAGEPRLRAHEIYIQPPRRPLDDSHWGPEPFGTVHLVAGTGGVALDRAHGARGVWSRVYDEVRWVVECVAPATQ